MWGLIGVKLGDSATLDVGDTPNTVAAGDHTHSADSIGAIPNTVIDAKGDLIVGTEADTAIRLPIGTDGQVLTADAELSTGVKWADVSTPGTPPVSYAVQWTSSSNPQPANGTLTGHYIAVGKLITAWGELRIDASTTFGTNAWYFSLPVLANTELLREGGYQAIGQVWAKDYGADNYLGTAVMINNAKFSVYPAPTGTSSWRPTVPFKWAEGDSLSFKVQYIAV